jgi:putative spermidine/putrescine transport system substrate-binding protein/spermidine/putrescine transport system substrate-binding protein
MQKASQHGVNRRTLLKGGSAAVLASGWAPGFKAFAAEAPKASGVINMISWEGYDFPEQMKAWREGNQIEVQATYMGSHDDIQAKILGGGGEGLDLITYGSSYKELYRELKILTPIDPEKIPNLANLIARAVLFLASDDSCMCTGQQLIIDGGWV